MQREVGSNMVCSNFKYSVYIQCMYLISKYRARRGVVVSGGVEQWIQMATDYNYYVYMHAFIGALE